MAVKDDTIRRIAQQAGATLVYVDKSLRVRFANRRCHELLGHAPDTLHSCDIAELVDTATMRVVPRHVAEAEQGGTGPRQYVLRHKDGSRKFVQVTAVADRDPAGQSVGYVLSTSDGQAGFAATVGERERLAAANHALRTPLASIIAALELLKEETLAGAAGTPESLVALALENAGRLAAVVEQWLDMERLQADGTLLCATPLELEPLLAGLLAELAPSGEAGVRLEVASATARARVKADAKRLRQAIAQLIAGAIERSPAGSTVRVALAVRGRRAAVTVADDGPHAALGGDLGLLVAQAIIKRCDGTLSLEQRPHKGTRIVVELPCLEEDVDA
jgi:PAS domain S-box-containing protein